MASRSSALVPGSVGRTVEVTGEGSARGTRGIPTVGAAEPCSGDPGAQMVKMQQRRLTGALVEVVGGDGLPGATVGAVCQRAGVSRRTFYELFEDRDACLLVALESALARLADEVLPAYQGPGSWHERVRSALSVLLERFDADLALARMCVVETLRAGPAVQECRARALSALVEAIDEGRGEAAATVPSLTAQGVVGGALAVLHAHLIERSGVRLSDLLGSLTAMIVHPYLGPASAEEELAGPVVGASKGAGRSSKDPFSGVTIRFTYRTAQVLAAIAECPGASNRQVGHGAGIADEGQTSRLLSRLRDAGLIANDRSPGARGERNAWSLTERGQAIHAALTG